MFESKTIGETIRELDCDPSKGLSESEISTRREKWGENRLKQSKSKSYGAMFLEQLNEPLIFILFIAAAVSLLLREFSDTAIILTVIVMNAVVGVVQEGKAQKALEALKKLTSPTALVKRDGVYDELPAAALVPGDIVVLEAGRQIPADLRIISSSSLKVEEAALTGESLPIEKDARFVAKKDLPIGDRLNMVYMSTSVIYGRGEGIVTATGMNTEIGKIAGLIDEAPEESTPLQKRLADLGKLLSIVAVVLCIALFGIALIQKRAVLEMLITAISLAVAAVPEGLPAVVTIVLALSVSRMVRINTIVRKLPSVETLGAVSIVCSDKTGTLTQNKMTVTHCYTNDNLFPVAGLNNKLHKTFLEGFTLCNDAFISEGHRIGDPTELALIEMGLNRNIERNIIEKELPRINEIPFDSDRKMMTTVHGSTKKAISYTKGSCDEILRRCTHININDRVLPLTDKEKKKIALAMESMASQALRVLALAMKKDVTIPSEQGLIFIGMVGMIDPARPEVYDAIDIFKGASVKTVMITGDHIDTAFAIAKQLKIAREMSECISGNDLDKLSEEQLNQRINMLSVFARVSPEHKVRIVRAFKNLGYIVAMTGDGVNDAPALKSADIGIAMGMNGTDVAKNASDIILTDDNFATIEKAIEEGRGIYENIKKSVLFLLSSNFGEIITMFFAVLMGLATPLKASHILWVNLITDSLPALALGVDENDTKLLMEKPPRSSKESLFAHGGLACTLFYGALIAGISLLGFLTIPIGFISQADLKLTVPNIMSVLSSPEILTRSQTYAFTVLGISQLFHAIGMRNTEQSVFRMKHTTNKLMIIAFILGILLQVAVTEVPYLIQVFGTAKLSLFEWFRLILLSSMPLLAHEMLLIGKKSPKHKKEAVKV